MKLKIHIAMLLVALIAASCSGEHNAHANHFNYEEPKWPPVELDNGAKWKANAETTHSISVMKELIANQSAKLTAAELKEKLQNEFKLIFKNCTMTGAAHDQLHNYLLPLRDKINTLNEENRNFTLADLKEYLGSYNKYFE